MHFLEIALSDARLSRRQTEFILKFSKGTRLDLLSVIAKPGITNQVFNIDKMLSVNELFTKCQASCQAYM